MAAISPFLTTGATVMAAIDAMTVITVTTVTTVMNVITDTTVLVACMTVALTTWLRCPQLARRKLSSTPGGVSPQSGQLGKMFSPCTSLLESVGVL